MAAALATGLKVAFTVLGCVTIAYFCYIGVTHGIPYPTELFHTLWSTSIMMDYLVNSLLCWTWIFCKEPNWIHKIIWIIPGFVLGSAVFLPYIVLQLIKLSPQESLQDPIYFVIRSNTKGDESESKSILSVICARVLFGGLGCFMLGLFIYVAATNGSPFHWEILTPWVLATVIDVNNILIIVSVWVAYKEPTWISAAIWIIFLLCLRSIGACAYFTVQLFQLSHEDPVSFVLFSGNSRAGNAYAEI